MMTKLTTALARRVTESEPPTRDLSYFDIEVRGLALRVRPKQGAGKWAAFYFVRYTAPDGRERRVKLGDARVVSLEEARALARKTLGQVAHGQDPAATRAALQAAWTLADAAQAYLASPAFAQKAPGSQAEDRRVIELHLVHRLGREKLAAINVPMLRRLVHAVETDRRVNARKRKLGGPGAARRAIRLLSVLLSWAVGEGRLSTNPITGNFRMSGDSMRETVITTPEQYGALFAAMDLLVAQGKLRPSVRAFVTLIAGSGMRRDEARKLRWGDVDLNARRLTLHESKGSRLARRGPRVDTVSLLPLTVIALAGIRSEQATDDDLVFPPQRGAKLSVNRDWLAIREAAGLPSDLTIHGLRHSAGTVAIMSGLSTAEAQRLLRHRNISTTQRYLHLAEAAQARLADRALGHLLPQPSDDVSTSTDTALESGSANG